jgi:hypothetical protein
MTVVTGQLSESLQTLIDTRLDTIDRMLLGRVGRQDRLAIVREVESQIFELLQERDGRELGRDDVLAVLARLDPPEAYLPDETDGEPPVVRRSAPPRAAAPLRKGDSRLARASSVLGLSALALVLISPLLWVVLGLTESEALLILGSLATIGSMFAVSLLGLVLGVVSRLGSVWAVVGVVTSVLALVTSTVAGLFLALELVG